MNAPGADLLTVPASEGVTLALHDFGGQGTTLLLCQPTGFHGLVWQPVAVELTDIARVVAVDFRGHGDSTVPASGALPWAGFGDDVAAVADFLGPRAEPLIGAGISMGGAALLLAEQARPGTFTALWCFEPIVFPRMPGRGPAENPLAAGARRRRAVFPDRAAAFANYAAKPPLGSLAPEALEAYVAHGFRDLPDGGVELKCTPEVEAAVFEGGMDNGAFERLGEVRCPVTVVAGGDGGYPAQAAPLVADALPDGHLEQFEDLSHFGPMEAPGTIADAIRKVLERPGR